MQMINFLLAVIGLAGLITTAAVPDGQDPSATAIKLLGHMGTAQNISKVDQRDENVLIGCTGRSLNQKPLSDVVHQFCAYFHGVVPAHRGNRLSLGGVSFYECNYADWSQACDDGEIAVALQGIRDQCGNSMSGWWFHRKWNKNYGYDSDAVAVCANLRRRESLSGSFDEENMPVVARE